MIDAIARHSPNFKDLILHAEMRTPRDIENEVGLTEGNIFQGELTFDQLLFNRPDPRLRAVPRAAARPVHVRLEHPPGRRRDGRARRELRRARSCATCGRTASEHTGAARSYDSIIIGGGHNGLVCATYLARGGPHGAGARGGRAARRRGGRRASSRPASRSPPARTCCT